MGLNYFKKGKIIMPRKARKFMNETKILHIVVHAIGQEYIYKEDRQKYEYIKLMKYYKDKKMLSDFHDLFHTEAIGNQLMVESETTI